MYIYPHFQDQILFFVEHEQISMVKKKSHKLIENSP